MKTFLVDAVGALIVPDGVNYKVFTEMYELLETFSNRKIILTGADDEQYKKFGLETAPYEVFTLKHNPEKTDPKYFKTLLDRYGLGNDEVVYFEHNKEAVKSAEAVGIKSFYYDSDKKDLYSLKNFLTENQ